MNIFNGYVFGAGSARGGCALTRGLPTMIHIVLLMPRFVVKKCAVDEK